MIKIVNRLILTLIIISFILYFFSSHPIVIASIVILQSILIARLISKKAYFRWFGFFIFIIYLGGILILFSYIIRLINSKREIFSTNKITYTTLIILFIFNLFKEKKRFLEIPSCKFTKLIISTFRLRSIKLRIFLILFLLLVIIIVVFITETRKGNIRKI